MAWGKAGSTTLGSAGDALTTTGMTASKFNQFMVHTLTTAGTIKHNFIFDNNSNTDYARRRSNNGVTDSTDINQPQIEYFGDGTSDKFEIVYSCNISGEEKLNIHFLANQNAVGVGNVPDRSEAVSKADTTTNSGQYTRVDCLNTDGGGDYDTSSNLSILGSEVTPSAGKPTNVQVGSRWEETDTRKMYHYEAGDPTYESDFTTNTGWVEADSTNTGVDTSTERLDFNIVRSTTNGKAYYDLGSALSDTAWVIRFKCVMTASANGAGSNTIGSFGMSSVTGDALTTQDFLGHYKAGNGDDVSVVVDGSNLGPGTGSSLGRPLAGTTRYHEMKRTSATSWTNSIYSTSDYSGTPDATHTLTIASSIIGLRYFNIANYNSGSGAGVLSGYIDDVKIYDGVTTASMPNAWSEEGT